MRQSYARRRPADDRVIKRPSPKALDQILRAAHVIADGQADRLAQPPPFRKSPRRSPLGDRAFERFDVEPFEPPRQFLRHPYFVEPPADIGAHPHPGHGPVNRLDAIDHVANALLGRLLCRGDALHLVKAKALFPTPLRVLGRVRRRLVAGALRNRHPLAHPPTEQLRDRHPERLAAQIEHGLLERSSQRRLGLRQIHLQHIAPHPGSERLGHNGRRRRALDLGQPNEPLIGLHLAHPMLVALVLGLAISVVRPPPVALGHIDYI